MSSVVEKIVFVILGFVICLSVLIVGCESIPKDKPNLSAKDPISTANTTVADSATTLKGTTATIKSEANAINKVTPPSLKTDIEPHTSKILEQTGVQDNVIKQLETIKGQLEEATNRVTKLESDFQTEHAARLKAEENVTKEFRRKIMGWSAFCFFAMLLCGGIAVFSQGNKIAIYGGVVCAAGLAVCVMLIQTIALIPWIVGGIAVLAAGLFVYVQFFKDKKIKNLDTATKELTETVEGQKPLMGKGNRQFFFGDGPIPGKVNHIQSSVTKEIVNTIRAASTFKKASAIPPSDFIDLNGDGIDDNLQRTIKVVADTVNIDEPRKKRASGVASMPRTRLILT
jgi:hypothetical protein